MTIGRSHNLEDRPDTLERVVRRFRRHWNDKINECVGHVTAARVGARAAQGGDFEALLQVTAALELALAYRDRVLHGQALPAMAA